VWLIQLFEGIKIPPEALPKMLECTEEVLRQRLSPEMMGIVNEYIQTATKRIQDELAAQPSFVTSAQLLSDLFEARNYEFLFRTYQS
jgi:hypothetical protein